MVISGLVDVLLHRVQMLHQAKHEVSLLVLDKGQK